MHGSGRIRRTLGIAAVSALCLTGTAWAGGDTTTSVRETCLDPQIEQPFAAFGDTRAYVLAPGGSFEDSSLDQWTLEGGASVQPGNDPFNLRGAEDAMSLSVPAGASATSPRMCVDLNWPTMRFAALQEEARDTELKVEVLYPEAPGKAANWHKAKTLKAKSNDGWELTGDIKLSPQVVSKRMGARQVAVRFTSDDDRGSWRIDNIYVDPRMK